MTWWLRVMVVLILSATALPAMAQPDEAFTRWAEDFQRQAIHKGIPEDVVRRAFDGLEPDPRVIELDQKQPEKKITLEKYLKNTINGRRISTGRDLLSEHSGLLNDISRTHGVQPKFIVALWGIESDFGQHQGGFSVIRSLATLAYEGRRRELFSGELMAALKIVAAEGMDPADLTGSWAGAMGNCQFMPTTYLRFAVDEDGDGHRDIWNSTPDSLASIANYLRSLKWQDDRGWGVPVTFPPHFKHEGLDHARKAGEWRKLGVDWPDNAGQFGGNVALYAIYADKPNDVTYLVTDNFKAILQWNRSRYFATAVGTLADQLGE